MLPTSLHSASMTSFSYKYKSVSQQVSKSIKGPIRFGNLNTTIQAKQSPLPSGNRLTRWASSLWSTFSNSVKQFYRWLTNLFSFDNTKARSGENISQNTCNSGYLKDYDPYTFDPSNLGYWYPMNPNGGYRHHSYDLFSTDPCNPGYWDPTNP
jgi:hypothetical protein